MIEAVNSVLSNASVTRVAAEQQSTSRSLSANPEKIQEAAVRAPYISPYISIDRQSNRAVLQIRDSDTGDVVTQYPTEGQLKAYQTAQSNAARSEQAEIKAPETSSAPSTQQAETVSLPEAGSGSVAVETEA